MTTSNLIKELKKIEFGASGRPREISFVIKNKNGLRTIYEPEVSFYSSGDGICGAEVSFLITPK